jgi:macrophage erythroblast attacher
VSGISSSSATSTTAASSSTEAVLRNLDSMIERMRGTKRKLAGFAEEEQRLYQHEGARARHLAEIYAMQGVEDVRYEAWSRVRLDRMLVDYLLRRGHGRSARLLAQEKGIEELVDVDTFEQMARIRESLLRGSVTEALAWCTAGDTKKELRKMDVGFPLPPCYYP